LITSGFFKDIGIFRVQRGYVVQFGISDNQAINRFWDKHPIKDEPVSISNLRGYISFARDGVETRTTQLFINLNDNLKLDTVNYNGLRGFPPVARIIKGFTTVESFYSGYGFEPANHQDSVLMYGNSYLKKKFPEIDYILEARIIKN
jgi:cyclophilin family peptidyl-prolyl cis-trans isomerase